MPGLDVNEVLTDPDLATTFDVRRQQEAVGLDGRAVVTPVLIVGLVGVITFEDGPIEQGEDASQTPQAINIATPFSLRDASFGFQPDVVIWQGTDYRVTAIKAHRHFGRGWTRARAASTRASDNPPPTGSTA